MIPVICLRDVWKSYRGGQTDVAALRGVSLDLERGEFVALVGPSGCGKSTLLNLIAGVDAATRGTLTIDGKNIGELSDDQLAMLRRTSIGYVFQFFNLLPTMTVKENVELPLLIAGWPRDRSESAALTILQQVGMHSELDRRPSELSGGQQQRVAIARAVVHDPILLLADEPTGNLDSNTGAEILGLLRQVCDEHATTILMATHNSDAAAKADRVMRMRDGLLEP